MKRTVTVNIGGQAFIIDEDAYAKLQEYLLLIEKEIKYFDDKHEILRDVEIRIAEIFKENSQGGNKVIDLKDIEDIIKIMGNPSDFSEMYDGSSKEHFEKTSYKRIYRDPDNKVLGGVCGGLGAYFNVDPVIIRILFIALVIAGGAGLLIYIILWIVVPEAKTVAQKLEMRGEPVNISNIGEKLKDEFNNVKRKMNL